MMSYLVYTVYGSPNQTLGKQASQMHLLLPSSGERNKMVRYDYIIFGGLRLTTDNHVNATKMYLHFGHFAKVVLC